jgi:hypothetical protein
MSLDDWVPEEGQKHTPDPDVCEDCGGQGEIIMGDGGTGVYGQYSETGYTELCTTCGGTGDKGLVYAREGV